MNDNEKVIRLAEKAAVTEDPASSVPIGGKLEFRSVPFPISNNTPLQTVKNWDHFQGAVIAIYTVVKGIHEVYGSGFMVGPGIAITAKHTFTAFLADVPKEQFAGMCIGISPTGIALWRIKTITYVDNTDILILGLTAASKVMDSYTNFALSTRCPSNGESVALLGFRRKNLIRNDSQPEFSFEGNLFCATGIVINQYPTGRDSVMMPWPTLEIDCHTVGGMSGGPVIDKNGFVVGLISSSLDSEQKNGPTFVSLLWPSLSMKFEAVWPTGFFKDRVSFLDIDQRLVFIERREAVTHDEISNKTRYEVWT